MRPNLITRLKEEWNNLDPVDPLRGLIADAIDALAEQPAQQQEPVAWVNQANLNSAAIQRNRGGQGDTHTWSETPTWDHSVPLYTSPPQRKPLTDEEIWDEVKAADLDWQTGWSLDEDASNRYITFARAIEASHGIEE